VGLFLPEVQLNTNDWFLFLIRKMPGQNLSDTMFEQTHRLLLRDAMATFHESTDAFLQALALSIKSKSLTISSTNRESFIMDFKISHYLVGRIGLVRYVSIRVESKHLRGINVRQVLDGPSIVVYYGAFRYCVSTWIKSKYSLCYAVYTDGKKVNKQEQYVVSERRKTG